MNLRFNHCSDLWLLHMVTIITLKRWELKNANRLFSPAWWNNSLITIEKFLICSLVVYGCLIGASPTVKILPEKTIDCSKKGQPLLHESMGHIAILWKIFQNFVQFIAVEKFRLLFFGPKNIITVEKCWPEISDWPRYDLGPSALLGWEYFSRKFNSYENLHFIIDLRYKCFM